MASLPEVATVKVKVEPDLSDFEVKHGGIAMIILTHPEGDGPAEGRKYSGRVFVDARRIQSIEEILIEGEAPVSFLTLHDGIAIRVSETPEEITARMSEALWVPAVSLGS